MRIGGSESDNIASSEKATQLHLAGGTAGLSDDWCRRDRNDPSLQSRTMVGPDTAVVAVCGDEHAGVVDGAHADRFRGAESSCATR